MAVSSNLFRENKRYFKYSLDSKSMYVTIVKVTEIKRNILERYACVNVDYYRGTCKSDLKCYNCNLGLRVNIQKNRIGILPDDIVEYFILNGERWFAHTGWYSGEDCLPETEKDKQVKQEEARKKRDSFKSSSWAGLVKEEREHFENNKKFMEATRKFAYGEITKAEYQRLAALYSNKRL